jgi:hypothetical protein
LWKWQCQHYQKQGLVSFSVRILNMFCDPLQAVDKATLMQLRGKAAMGYAFDRRYGSEHTSDSIYDDCVANLVEHLFKVRMSESLLQLLLCSAPTAATAADCKHSQYISS